MRFKRKHATSFFASAAFLFLALIDTGCGILGSKNAPVSQSNVNATGCLNNTSDLVSRYIAGQISDSEWKAVFDCVNTSLDFFTDYVHGSAQDSYSESDFYTLVSKFLITDQPVHQALLAGAFSLKASLLGGTQTEVTKDEITLLKNSLNTIRDITTDLIPYLAIRQQANPSYDQLNSMVVAFQNAGAKLSAFVATLPTELLSDQAVQTLITELGVSLNVTVANNLSDTIFAAKWMLLNTRRDAVENTEWPQVFQLAMSLSGVVLAYEASVGTDPTSPRYDVVNRLENDYRFREFLMGLAQTAKPYLENMLAAHGGAVPLPLVNHLIEDLPKSLLGSVTPSVVEEALIPLTRKILQSNTGLGIDQGVIDTIYSVMSEMVADLGALDRFYENTGLDVNSSVPSVFIPTINQYYTTLSPADQVRFGTIKDKLISYRPKFYQGTSRIQFQNGIGYSKIQHVLVLAVDRIGRLIAKSYGSGPDYFVDADLTNFFYDFTDILYAMHSVDPTITNFGPKQRQNMDLFTDASDGNGQASIPELVDYAMSVVSAYAMGDQMRAEITPACDSGLGVDLMGWTKLPADCFRKEFNLRLSYWLNSFPRLQKYWNTLTVDEQAKAMIWLEHGARRDGYTNEDFDKYDIEAMATILHLTETLFERFDADSNEVISKAEVQSAFPLFALILSQKANTSVTNKFELDGVFTYIVKYRSMPQTSGFVDILKLGWWLAIYDLPTTTYSTDRVGVFNIVCQLALPETSAQQALTPTICSP
jgi:hypothetical protein